MKTIKELNEEILKTTMTIEKTSPELSKYLKEMPITLPDQDSPEVDAQILQDYLNSLNALLATYKENKNIKTE